MNLNQINGIIRAVVPMLCGYAVGKGWITNEMVGDITTACITFAAAGWSVYTNREGKPS